MRLGAFVARLLNSGQPITRLDDGRIYSLLMDSLNGTGPQGRLYSRYLAGHALVQNRCSPEQAADTYFECVIDRPLFLARSNHYHKGHELLLALYRRGTGWEGSALARSFEPASIVPMSLAKEFNAAKARLSGLSRETSKGNPAAATRLKHGPLYMGWAGAGIELPEELSLWGAISAAPRELATLEGRAWVSFRNLLIRAFEAANAPYAALLSIGLWPPDWRDAVSSHQAKQLSAFLSLARKMGDGHSIKAWRVAWDRGKTVASFASADELWDSGVGRALRDGPSYSFLSDLDIGEVAAEGFEDAAVEEADFEKILNLCRESGAIDELEEWLFLEIRDGRNACDLAQDPRMQERLHKARLVMAGYLDALRERVHRYVASLGEIHPDS